MNLKSVIQWSVLLIFVQFLNPMDFAHANRCEQSHLRFIDWLLGSTDNEPIHKALGDLLTHLPVGVYKTYMFGGAGGKNYSSSGRHKNEFRLTASFIDGHYQAIAIGPLSARYPNIRVFRFSLGYNNLTQKPEHKIYTHKVKTASEDRGIDELKIVSKKSKFKISALTIKKFNEGGLGLVQMDQGMMINREWAMLQPVHPMPGLSFYQLDFHDSESGEPRTADSVEYLTEASKNTHLVAFSSKNQRAIVVTDEAGLGDLRLTFGTNATITELNGAPHLEPDQF